MRKIITHLIFILFLFFILASFTPLSIAKQKPPSLTDPPILKIDTGGHKAIIRDTFFTRDGRYLVSASDDKTVRVWDVQTGKTVRIIRGQIGKGHEGKIFAAALSPNEQWLAVGGWMDSVKNYKLIDLGAIRIIDFVTGHVKELLKGHEGATFGISFSSDNRLLISGSSDKIARIWDVATGKCLHTLSGHTNGINAV
jgi:WD40 repeat protein